MGQSNGHFQKWERLSFPLLYYINLISALYFGEQIWYERRVTPEVNSEINNGGIEEL
jgi:hypothetical protein